MAEIPRIFNDFKVKIRLSEEFGNGKSRTTCQIFEDKQKKIPAIVKFETSHARVATNEIATHLIELGHKTASDHERVLMVFVQSNRDCHGAEDTLVALKLRPISRGTERCVHRAGSSRP